MIRLAKHPEVVCTELEDGAVLLNLETRWYYSLDRVGLAIWNLIDSAGSRDELIDQLMSSHEAGDESPGALVDDFLEQLRSETLVVSDDEEGEDSASPGSRSLAGQPAAEKVPLTPPRLLKHDEPLHEVPLHPFDPQLPLAE